MSRMTVAILAALSVAASAVVAVVHGATTTVMIIFAALAAGLVAWLSEAATKKIYTPRGFI